MPREYKCHYCKEILDEETDNIVEFIIGKTKPQTKRAHKSCRQSVLDKHEFYKLLYDVLEVISLEDKRIFQSFDELNKKGYSWRVMTRTLISKEKSVKQNLIKGVNYCLAIIRNSIPEVYRKAQEERNEKPIKIIKSDEEGDLTINIPKRELDIQDNVNEIEF